MTTCKACAAVLPPPLRASGRAREFCNNQCWYEFQRVTVQITCEACKRLASVPCPRGRIPLTCSEECRRQLATERRQATMTQRGRQIDLARTCEQCGVEYHKAHRTSKYCSVKCSSIQGNKARWSAIPRLCPICTGPLVRKRDDAYYTHCSPECGAIASATTRKTGTSSIAIAKPRAPSGVAHARYLTCSDKSRIKNREGIERFHRREIFERDAWTCHLCGVACDSFVAVPSPLAATIDHLVPLAHGGSHTRANVKCAHYSCNTKRGSRSLAECA